MTFQLSAYSLVIVQIRQIPMRISIPALFFISSISCFSVHAHYLDQSLTAEDITDFFSLTSEIMNRATVSDALVVMGVHKHDARENSLPGFFPTDASKTDFLEELLENSEFFFSEKLYTKQELKQRLHVQRGLTSEQFLAYLRIGFGEGRCSSPLGVAGNSQNCPATVYDLQMALLKGLDNIQNLRYPAKSYKKWKITFAQHREDIAYVKVFDYIASRFSQSEYNPLRDIRIDTSDDTSPACKLLIEMMKNGRAFEDYLHEKIDVPRSVAVSMGHLIDGYVETAYYGPEFPLNYRYGLFYFLNGENCSRITSGKCYEGEPELYQYLLDYLFIPAPYPAPYAHYFNDWSCEEIALIIDTLTSNPDGGPLDYSILEGRESDTYQYEPDDFCADYVVDLTAEDLLLFFVALANAQVNQIEPNDFEDTIPAHDIDAMGVDGIANPEYLFQYLSFRYIYDLFLE